MNGLTTTGFGVKPEPKKKKKDKKNDVGLKSNIKAGYEAKLRTQRGSSLNPVGYKVHKDDVDRILKGK